MNASAESGAPAPLPPGPECLPLAEALADAYLEYLSALWRGEPQAGTFARRLERFWDPALEETDGTLLAFSPHGAGGRGIEWRSAGDEIWGCIPGYSGGYRIPRSLADTLANADNDAVVAVSVRCPGGW
jgi:hypothetical protein